MLLGTKELYDWCDHNDKFEIWPVDWVNNPIQIAQQHKMVSINGCMMIDLYGQVVSEWVNGKQFSGVGGQLDFLRGAMMCPDGKSILCTPSTAKHGEISKIVLNLPVGAMVTCTRMDVDYICTEYGIVRLRGLTNKERAEALISIAHPKFRQQLKEEYEAATHLKLDVKVD